MGSTGDAIVETAGSAQAATPDQPEARIGALDFVRGVAILGILFSNINFFGWPYLAYWWAEGIHPLSTGERAVWLAQFLVVDGKMRGLFCLLFGAGMILFVQNAAKRTQWPRLLQLRRIAWLLVLGWIHYYLIWPGDILFAYAVSGIVALLFLPLRPRFLIGLAVVILLFDTWGRLSGLVPMARTEQAVLSGSATPQAVDGYHTDIARMRKGAAEEAHVRSEGWLAGVKDRLTNGLMDAPQEGIGLMGESMPTMLLGMGLFKLGWFSGGVSPTALRRWALGGIGWGLFWGLVLGLYLMSRDYPPYLDRLIFYGPNHLVRMPMVIGLSALLVLLFQRGNAAGWLGQRLAAVGRMAFSNYIAMSVIMTGFFTWGLHLSSQVDRVGLLAFVALGWLLMLAWSKPWLERFRFGPLEWLWRSLTYWRLAPFRRQVSA